MVQLSRYVLYSKLSVICDVLVSINPCNNPLPWRLWKHSTWFFYHQFSKSQWLETRKVVDFYHQGIWFCGSYVVTIFAVSDDILDRWSWLLCNIITIDQHASSCSLYSFFSSFFFFFFFTAKVMWRIRKNNPNVLILLLFIVIHFISAPCVIKIRIRHEKL